MRPGHLACAAGALLILAQAPGMVRAASIPPNFSITNIPPPGFPHFDNTADLTLLKTGTGPTAAYQMTANWNSGAFLFQTGPSLSFTVTGSYSVTANFSSSGALTSGTVTVNGTVPGYNGPGAAPSANPQLLYQANLTAFNVDPTNDGTPAALGFRTESPTGWAAQFQTDPESLYVYGFNVASFMSSFTTSKFRASAYGNTLAYTTVPVPAAAWLFGSAVLTLAGWRRRGPAHNPKD